MSETKSDRIAEVQSGSPAVDGAMIDFAAASIESSTPFIGEWRTLVSTTNWEKGRIISEWRASLESAGAAVAEYSDEAWSQLVGGVTSQHVGRLRRVHLRFGDAYSEYEGLYWSHFHAAIDWEDAEMWLEGALQSGWSVSQMRGKRWETIGEGAPAEADPEQLAARSDLTAGDYGDGEAGNAEEQEPTNEEATGTTAKVSSPSGESAAEENDAEDDAIPAAQLRDTPAESDASAEPLRPFADLAELPDDLADVFEQFKLAILNHKLTGWTDISRDDVVGALESLKQLALAPADE